MRSEYLTRRLWSQFWDLLLPIIMIDPVVYDGLGPVCKLTLQISPSFKVDTVLSEMP